MERPQFAGERIPTLEDSLATVPAGKKFYVEIKCGTEIIAPLTRIASTCGLDDSQLILICLDLHVAAAIKKSIPTHPVLWVVEYKHDPTGRWTPTNDEILAAAKQHQFDGLDLVATGLIDPQFVRQAKSANLHLCVWTVDDPVLARRLIDLGIEGITTNRPAWLREQFARKP